MKKAILAGMFVITVGMFTGCGLMGGKDIGKDAALEAALNDAGVSESDTTRLKVSQDRDDGRSIYEISFDAAGKEYDYEVQASDGKILSSDVETIQNNDQGTGVAQTQQQTQTGDSAGSRQSGTTAGTADVALTQDDAAAIALERVPGASQSDLRIALDYDDGVYKYEGDIIYEQKEYEFEIDANSGTILQWSEERI